MISQKLIYTSLGYLCLALNIYLLSANKPNSGLILGIIAAFWFIKAMLIKRI